MRLVFAVSVCISLLVATATAQAVSMDLGNIMPLGDSITGGGTPGGYRQELYNNLTAAGYSFRFVGSQTTYPTSTLTSAVPDQSRHEGHDGYNVQQIIDGVQNSNWLNANPDIILLHIGANDSLAPNIATAPDRLDTLLGRIIAKKPNARIIVAKIIGGSTANNNPNATAYDSNIATYNAAIEQKVADRNNPHITMVDMYSLMNIHHQTNELGQQYYADMAHPNQLGYNLMGDAWAGAIKSALSTPEPSSMVLLITSLIGLLAYAWRKRKYGGRAWWTVGVLATSLLGGLTGTPRQALSAWTIGKPIVTYYAGPGREIAQTEATATQLANGGWNLVWVNTLLQLNMVQAHGLRAMWTGTLDDSTVKAIRNHPALYSYYLGDEPLPKRFSELAKTVSHLRALDPNHLAYVNIFPTFAIDQDPVYKKLGYQEYLRQYMSVVKPAMLSYDHYQFWNRMDTSGYFKNLAIISHTAKKAGIPFMNIVQASAFAPGVRIPTENELRFLYNTTLAYGASGISDYVYYAPGHTGGMARADGTTTTLYDAAKTINAEFAAIGQRVQSMHHIGAYHLGDLPPGYGTTDGSSPLRLPDNSPFTITGVATTTYEQDKPVKGAVLGLFGSGDQLGDATHAMVVNLNYSGVLNTRVTGRGNLSVFDLATGKWIAQAHPWADVSIAPGGSTLVGLTSAVPESASATFRK